ncbi:MAG: hypothetical protein HYV97_08385 [Bdellovibrio sp.]|nr:hypothetical protein [Bdellovibrio sp.]
MKILLAIIILSTLSLSNLVVAADAGDSEVLGQMAGNEIALDDSFDQEKSTTQWEDENKFLVEGTRSTSSTEQGPSVESEQVEYEVIEQ